MNEKADTEEIRDILKGIQNSLKAQTITPQSAMRKLYNLSDKFAQEIGLHIKRYMALEGIYTSKQTIALSKQDNVITNVKNSQPPHQQFYETSSHFSHHTYIEPLDSNKVMTFLNSLQCELFTGIYKEV